MQQMAEGNKQVCLTWKLRWMKIFNPPKNVIIHPVQSDIASSSPVRAKENLAPSAEQLMNEES